MLNEKKLSALIKKDTQRIVNIFDDYIQYCNGYIVANLDYENHNVIQTLFKVGAVKNYRNIEAVKTRDLSDVINYDKEFEAVKTPYIKDLSTNYFCYVFKIDGKYYSYNKDYVDIFKECSFKASLRKDEIYPLLRIYNNDEFAGLILPVRDYQNDTDEFMNDVSKEDIA